MVAASTRDECIRAQCCTLERRGQGVLLKLDVATCLMSCRRSTDHVVADEWDESEVGGSKLMGCPQIAELGSRCEARWMKWCCWSDSNSDNNGVITRLASRSSPFPASPPSMESDWHPQPLEVMCAVTEV